MKIVGIRDLQTNPSKLTKAIENKQCALITKRDNPIGVVVSLNDDILKNGLKTALLIENYKSGNMSLGQLASSLDISKQKAMKLVSMMGIDCIDYDFEDDLKTVSKFDGSSK